MKRPAMAMAAALLMAAAGAVAMRRMEEDSGGSEAMEAAPGAAPDHEASEDPAPEEEELRSGPARRTHSRATLVPRGGGSPSQAPDALGGALRWLVKSQNASGSWGSGADAVDGSLWTPTSATALAMLAMMGAGYATATREIWPEGSPGEAMRRAEEWLSAARPGSDREAALIAFALSEDFGLTARESLRAVAQQAEKDLEALQRTDGSWGDAVESAWAALALKSAEIDGVEVDPDVRDRAKAWFESRLETGGPSDALGWMFLSRDRKSPELNRLLRRSTHALPDAANPCFEASYFGSMAAFQFDGPGGPVDRRWVNALKGSLAATPEEGGGWKGPAGWTGTVVRNALGALSLERYSAYGSVFGGGPEDLEPLDDVDPPGEPEGQTEESLR